MNRFDMYPGDFMAATAKLTASQLGVYTRLMCTYYRTEEPIEHECRYQAALAVSEETQRDTDWVLSRFFDFDGSVWRQDRCDSEIAKAKPRIKSARENGKLGGRPAKTQSVPKSKPNWEPKPEPTANPKRKLPSPSPSDHDNPKDAGSDPRPPGAPATDLVSSVRSAPTESLDVAPGAPDAPPVAEAGSPGGGIPTSAGRLGAGRGLLGLSPEQVLAIPIKDRARAVPDQYQGQMHCAHKWPEVLDLAARWCEALGWHQTDFQATTPAVMRLVALLATFSADELTRAIQVAPSDDYVRSRKGLGALTIDVVSQLLAKAPAQKTATRAARLGIKVVRV